MELIIVYLVHLIKNLVQFDAIFFPGQLDQLDQRTDLLFLQNEF